MKRTILDFLARTQKATAAVAGGVSILASATFLPAPWGLYAASAGLVLTWLLTYFFPYVEKAVEEFPFGTMPVESAPIEGEIIEPETDEIPAQQNEPTRGIPVIEGERAEFVPPFTGAVSVQQVLERLAAEKS